MKLPDWVAPGPAVVFCALSCAACALVQSPAERAQALAQAAGLIAIELPDRRLRAFARRAPSGASATRVIIYVESDGAPWRAPADPPLDPTPLKPIVVRMMLSDPAPALAYLGRPCQYLDAAALAGCDPALWRSGRYSEEAVAAMNLAVDRLMRFHGASKLELVGYSGGGAMAALIASRRGDVDCLVTVAAPLDTQAWTAALGVSPLSGSLNPADAAGALARITQTHFRGGQDTLVPPHTTARFLDSVGGATVIDKEDFDHRCCWDAQWPALRAQSCLAR